MPATIEKPAAGGCGVVLTDAARAMRRRLGPIAWTVLEKLMLDASNRDPMVQPCTAWGQAPPWLEQAVPGARRAVERVDEAATLVARRLSRGKG